MKRITRVLEGRDGKDVYAGTGVSEAGLTGLAHAERKDIDLATTETGKPPLDMSSLIKSTIKAIWV